MPRLPLPRPPRWLLAIVLASAGAASAAACRDNGAPLRRLEMPDAGVPVAWKLEPGHALVGHLRIGSTRQIEGMARPLDQSLECDVTLQVLAPAGGRSGLRLRASFSNVELDWGLPPTAEYGAEDFLALASERLRKLQPWLELGPDGAIASASEPPADVPEELRELLAVLLEGLEASFYVLPAKATKKGATWADTRTAAEGAWTLQTQGRVDGLFRIKERELDVIALEIDTRRRSKTSGSGSESEGHARVLFATAGYVAELDLETQAFSADSGMVYRKIRADWRRSREIVPELVGGGEESTDDVQVISDPCNPDYVGPKTCDEAVAEPAPAVPAPVDDAADPEATGESGAPADADDGATTGG